MEIHVCKSTFFFLYGKIIESICVENIVSERKTAKNLRVTHFQGKKWC